jgi:hypothetical protein
VPSGLTAEERSLHDHLGGLDDRTMARLLALYWLGRRAAFAEPADADAYHVLLAHAEENLDHAPRYLTMKPSLGGILRAGLAILGV